MTLRQSLGDVGPLLERLEQVLDSEDAIVLLSDGRQLASYVRGFAASGCQLELIDRELAAVVRRLLQP
jgi:hypothetical protein